MDCSGELWYYGPSRSENAILQRIPELLLIVGNGGTCSLWQQRRRILGYNPVINQAGSPVCHSSSFADSVCPGTLSDAV